MPSSHPLGDYLRARRELLQPEDVGLPSGLGRRRVAGLRRSEVAVLAGISAEYYIKLEQGHETNPTGHVLDALSRALKLDSTATSYLHALAHLPERPSQTTLARADERTRWLIDSWPMSAAMILGRFNDILAVNPLMSALLPAYREGGNSLATLLLDPALREVYVEWEGLSMRSIGLFRSQAGLHPEHARAKEIIAELLHTSERFRTLWDRHDITGMTEGTHPLRHPVAGALSLHYAHLPLVGTDHHSIFLYYAEPGTPSEAALARLTPDR